MADGDSFSTLGPICFKARQVNDLGLKRRGIPTWVHEDFYRLFVILAFIDMGGHENNLITTTFHFLRDYML